MKCGEGRRRRRTQTHTHTHTLQSALKTAHNANPDKVRLQVLARSDKNAVTGLDRSAHFPPCTWRRVSLSRHVRCIYQTSAFRETYPSHMKTIISRSRGSRYQTRCNTACTRAHCSGLQRAHTWPGLMAYWCGGSGWKLITRGRRHNVVSVFPADRSYLSATFTQQSPGFAIVAFEVVNYSDVWNFAARCVNGALPRRSDPGQRRGSRQDLPAASCLVGAPPVFLPSNARLISGSFVFVTSQKLNALSSSSLCLAVPTSC